MLCGFPDEIIGKNWSSHPGALNFSLSLHVFLFGPPTTSLFYWQYSPSTPIHPELLSRISLFLFLIKDKLTALGGSKFPAPVGVSRHRVTIWQRWCERDSSEALLYGSEALLNKRNL